MHPGLRAHTAREFEDFTDIVTIDLSGMAVDRGAGVYLRTELDLVIGAGRAIAIGVSHARDDFELLAHESQARGLVALAASALNSKVAKERNILLGNHVYPQGYRGFESLSLRSVIQGAGVTGATARAMTEPFLFAPRLHPPLERLY